MGGTDRMTLLTAPVNAAVDAASALLVYGSVHSADPSTSGINELTGGTPTYARKALVWDPASGKVGAVTGGNLPVFDIPAGSTAAYLGFWSALSGGTFRGSQALSSSEVFTGQGTLTVTALTLTGS
jgi:hypothetical protein